MRILILFLILNMLSVGLPAQELTNIKDVSEVPATQKMKERMGNWKFTIHRKKNEEFTGRFLEYTPANWDRKSKLPMVIFLHGAGGRTEIKDTINILYLEYIPEIIRKGKTFDAIVLCPQIKSYWGDQGAEFIDQAMKTYAGLYDPDRIYLTGLSSGGGGTWETALNKHQILAAAVPICGIKKSPKEDGKLVDLPIWAFHNANDPYQSVEFTRAHVKAIEDAGGKYIIYTEYQETSGKSHMKNGKPVFPNCHAHAWITAYSDPKLWEWLFKQRKGKPELAK